MSKEKVIRVSDLLQFIDENQFDAETGDVVVPPPVEEDFWMLWPTGYQVVTQWYGVNRHLYSKFGLPGHEGLDMRAPNGSPIVACAPGEVYRVAVEEGQGGNYGIHVRIKHQVKGQIFKTVYAHFQRADVNVGDFVVRGQQIGLANNTGNSYGAHLHISLKLEGIGSDSFMPYDIINPVPYLKELFPGDGWQVTIGGNLRTEPRVGSDTLIRYINPGVTVQALDAQPDDWWKINVNGTVGYFWNPYKLAAI